MHMSEAGGKGKASSKGVGKGKGGPPPPPSGEEAAKVRADLEAKKRERMEKEKREAKEKIERAKVLEEARLELSGRYHLLAPMDINDVKWTELKLSLHLVGGKGDQSGGVHLIEFENGRAICLRQQSKFFPTELVADRVAAAMGVPVAKHRLVHPTLNQAEFELIESEKERVEPGYEEMRPEALEKRLGHLKQSAPEQYEQAKKLIEMASNKGTWMVLEFVQGAALDKSPGPLAAAGEELLRGLGRLCALDLLLNNMDRLPLPLWHNAGNLSNVMLRPAGDVVGIDQQVNAPTDSAGLEQYLGRVRSLVAQLFGAAGAPADAEGSPEAVSERLQRALREACGVELSEANLASINEGLRSGLRDAVACLDSGALQTSLDDAVATAGCGVKHWSNNTNLAEPAQEAARQAEFVRQVAAEVAAIVRACS